MKVGSSTATIIPASAKQLESRNTFIGVDEGGKRITLHVQDSFDVDGDGRADIERTRVLEGTEKLLEGDLRSGGKLVSERFRITDQAAGKRTLAEDKTGAGRLSSVLDLDWKTRTVTGEKDLNGDFTVDKKVDQVDGKVRISTSTRKDGQFDLVEWPSGGFGW